MTIQAILFPNIKAFNAKKIKELHTISSFIVAIDGGADNAFKMHITPQIVIGDMDSLSSKSKSIIKKKKIETLKYFKEKDETDFELAIDYIISKGIKNVVIAGLSGERTDHSMTNWMILINLYIKGYLESVKIIERNQSIYFSKKEWIANMHKGDIVSIIPLLDGVTGITTYGLKYKLKNENLKYGTSRGISNIAIEKKIRIKLASGSIMIIHNSKQLPS
jgi:thiamine pyrophosphokinase